MNQYQSFFSNLTSFLQNEVKCIANEIDTDVTLLKKVYKKLNDLNCLNLLIPSELGGLGGERAEWVEYNILLSQYSGALLFLQAQHQFAVSQLKKLLPNEKVRDLLKRMAQENLSLGIARVAQRNLLNIEPIKDGFKLSGKIPWVTGFDFFPLTLFSFDVDGKIYFSTLPFQTNPQDQSILISPVIETTILSSTQTVSITLNQYFISYQDIIASHPIQPKKPTEHPTIFNFAGLAKVLLEVSQQGKYFNDPMTKEQFSLLQKKWNEYYSAIIQNKSCPLQLRAQGYALAEKCMIFARIVCGAESILASHPINRIGKEIWQYSVAGYSVDQLHAYLNEQGKN